MNIKVDSPCFAELFYKAQKDLTSGLKSTTGRVTFWIVGPMLLLCVQWRPWKLQRRHRRRQKGTVLPCESYGPREATHFLSLSCVAQSTEYATTTNSGMHSLPIRAYTKKMVKVHYTCAKRVIQDLARFHHPCQRTISASVNLRRMDVEIVTSKFSYAFQKKISTLDVDSTSNRC